jgi:GNAT superfamily N-acetyltransferase
MGLRWQEEPVPRWDASKAAIIGAAPAGVFEFGNCHDGDLLSGQWWRAEDEEGEILGYGWLDCNWGDGEILVAVAPEVQGRGVGGFILERLQVEARGRGLYCLYNVVPAAHPEPDRLEAWLTRHGFERHGDGRLMRAVLPRRTSVTR